MKHRFVSQLRGDTCYPTFRVFVAVFTIIGYLVACAPLVFALNTGDVATGLLAMVASVVIAILVAITREASLMLADIADAALDTAWRNSEPAPVVNVATPFDSDLDLEQMVGAARR